MKPAAISFLLLCFQLLCGLNAHSTPKETSIFSTVFQHQVQEPQHLSPANRLRNDQRYRDIGLTENTDYSVSVEDEEATTRRYYLIARAEFVLPYAFISGLCDNYTATPLLQDGNQPAISPGKYITLRVLRI